MQHQPDVTNTHKEKEHLYNTPVTSPPPMKTFYTSSRGGVVPYATTTLVDGQNLLNQQRSAESAFRPIKPEDYIQQTPGSTHPLVSGSSDSCAKHELNTSDSSNHTNHGNNTPDIPLQLYSGIFIIIMIFRNLTLSCLNFPLSSSSTTSRKLLSQFSTCSG